MNLNPLTFLLIMAPAAVIGAVLFIYVYQSSTATADLERDRIRLESLEFRQEAAAVWNGEKVPGIDPEELAQLRQRIASKEQAAENAAQERCERLAAFGEQLTGSLGQQAPAADCN